MHTYSFAGTSNATTYGNLYNWYTATAGSGTQTGVTGGKDAPMSICPSAGKTTVDTTTNAPYAWKLPPNTGDGSYTNLFLTKAGLVTATNDYNTTFTNTIEAEPYGFALAGSYYVSTARGQGRNGDIQSRTSYDDNNLYRLDFYSSTDTQGTAGYFNLQRAWEKHLGRAVRCVLVTENPLAPGEVPSDNYPKHRF